MGEHILKVALNELLTVRIRCKNPKCGAVLELPLDNLEMADRQCPTCETAYFLGPADALRQRKRLAAFKEAVKDLLMMSGHYDVEFPINLDAHAAKSTD